jgi:hypothetical protein
MLGRLKRRLRVLLHALPHALFRAYFFAPRVTLLRLVLLALAKTACALAVLKATSLDA